MKKQIVLVESAQMGVRKEHGLVRIPKRVRTRLKPGQKTLEVYYDRSSTRDKYSKALEIRQAYKKDLQNAVKLRKEGGLSLADRDRMAFVSKRTFAEIAKETIAKGVSLVYIVDTVEDVLVGADPEFALIDQHGSVVSAVNVFQAKYLDRPLGADNYGLQVELRPEPSTDHSQLVETMRDILSSDPQVHKIEKYKWWATSYDKFGFGGHIHLGNTRLLEAKELIHAYYVIATRLLDELVAMPHSRVEAAAGIRRRVHTRFGHCGDFRNDLKPARLEWRTIGADWIAHPKLAKAVLGTTKAIVDEIFAKIIKEGYSIDYLIPPKYRKGYFADYTRKNNKARVHFRNNTDRYMAQHQDIYWDKSHMDWSTFPIVDDFGLSRSSKNIETKLYVGDVTPSDVRGLAKALRNMSSYSRYKPDIEYFVKVCSRNKNDLEKNFCRDLKEAWLAGKALFKN